MRQAHPLSLTAMVLLMAGVSPPLLAQPSEQTLPVAQSPASSHSVFNPAAPTLALQHQPLAASAAIVAQPGDWRAANAAVGEFTRGHGDLLRWEKSQGNASGSAPDSAASAHQHHHGGQP
ncbi:MULTISPECIES: hypothetical protein [Comamonas]|uniref:hypothetical protein n=1 Tax=Comamonas TaxID=283 RepID=UPI0015FB4966|nr:MULTISPECIES: hypothetical protein [Comamonas]UUC95378.1 hypothetical protein NOX35_08835 [Comamonas sp. C11]WEE79548.1 hypothetical protein LZ683_09395 [Comamonas testosteroni]